MVTRWRIGNSIWPYLGTIACLLLSLVVPHVWRIKQLQQEIKLVPAECFDIDSTEIVRLGGNDDDISQDHSFGGMPIFLREFARPTTPIEPDHLVAPRQVKFASPVSPADFDVAFNAANGEVLTQNNFDFNNKVIAQEDVAIDNEIRTQAAIHKLTSTTVARFDAAPIQTRKQLDRQTDNDLQSNDTYDLTGAPDRDAGRPDDLRDIGVPVPAFEHSSWTDPEWPVTEALLVQVQMLGAEKQPCSAWCDDVLAELQHLTTIPTLGHDDAAAVLQRLGALTTDGRNQVSDLAYGDDHAAFTRALYALERRLDLWKTLYAMASRGFPAADESAPAPQDILESLDNVQRILARHDRGIAWSEYLLLEDLRQAVTNELVTESRSGCELAQRIVGRIETTPLTKAQRAYLAKPDIQELAELLRPWACQDVDYTELLRRVERYEQTNRQHDGRFLAKQAQWLGWSTSNELSRIGRQLNRHWRNANFRVSVSGTLLNRYLPKPRSTHGHVNEFLAESSVYGSSWTTTQLRWNLIPDTQHIRMELEARGSVHSQTTADLGNIRTHNQGTSSFRAKKVVQFDHNEIHSKQAVATAQSSTSISRIDTNFDGIPFFGALAQSVARSRASERLNDAERLTRRQVVAAAERRLNRETYQRIEKMKELYYDRLFNPLENIGLNPTPIAFQTTDRRVIARYRLAGQHQLAAHSPRPLAPDDSLLSVQLHQSALNNLVEQLDLNGKNFDLDELYSYIPKKLGQEAVPIPDDVPDNLKLRFAAVEPVRFTFSDSRARITLRLASLSKGRRKRWRNVTVTGDYLPDRTAVDAYLFREESIRLTGHQLGFSDQIVLRGIFSKVLSRKRKYALLQKSLAKNPQFADLRINRFVIEDGWICVAWSAQRLADAVKSVQR